MHFAHEFIAFLLKHKCGHSFVWYALCDIVKQKGWTNMSRKVKFTEEQINLLSQNPYTHLVNKNRIVFTLAFKELFVEQMKIKGMSTTKILRAAGYDPAFFPRSNLDSIRKAIKDQAESPTGLQPPRGLSAKEKTAQFAAKNLEKQKQEKSIKELQKRVVHLEQQIEFLKKISHIRNQQPEK